MTCREKLKLEHPEEYEAIKEGNCAYAGCPSRYGYLKDPTDCVSKSCIDCWDREIPESDPSTYQHDSDAIPIGKVESVESTEEGITVSVIKDSGDRTEFSTGAVRDMHEGKGDMASVPWEAILRLSKHYENGAKKYERWNFRKGIPVSSFIDSAVRHLAKYQCGCDDEDHLAAAAFNVLGAMLMENTMPEMQDLPLREGKNTFDYFKKI